MSSIKEILKQLQKEKKKLREKKREKGYYTTAESFELLKINEKIKEYKRKIDK